MKKTKIAAGVVVALGVVWTAGAWFTGKQLEKHMEQLVQQANAQLQTSMPEARLKLSYQDFQRGVFSSSARFVLQSSSQTEDNSLLKPGQSVVFKESIDHGPFPLAQVKKFNLIPSMASVHSELENNETVKKLFEMAKGQSIVQAETRVGYGGGTDSDIHFVPVDYSNAQTGERVVSDGGKLNVSADDKGDKLAFKGNVGSLAFTAKNELDQPVVLTVNDLLLDADTHLSPEGMRIGDQNVTLKKLTAAVDGKESITAEGLNGKSSFDSENNRVSGQIDYTLDSLKIKGQEFGNGKVSVKLDGFDGKAMKTFSETYNRQIQALSNDPALMADPGMYQQRASEILTANLPLLLKGDPSVNIAPISWKNSKGESTFTLAAQFKDPSKVIDPVQDLGEQVDSVLKSLDTKLTISMPMATEMMTHVAQAEGYQEADAAKLADQQVKGLAAMGQMFKLTTQQDNNIATSVQYGNGQVTMNGEKMSLQQFMSRYMLGGAMAAPEMPQ